jgi:hypothetical protein
MFSVSHYVHLYKGVNASKPCLFKYTPERRIIMLVKAVGTHKIRYVLLEQNACTEIIYVYRIST